MIHIESNTHDELVQISIQLHWDRPHAMDSIATPPTYLQKGCNSRFLLLSQKIRWVSRRTVTGTIQRTFSMTLLAPYSPSRSAQLCEVSGINFVTPKSQVLESSDLSTSSYYQAKILHTSTLALLSLGSILPPLRPFFRLRINLDTTFSTNQH